MSENPNVRKHNNKTLARNRQIRILRLTTPYTLIDKENTIRMRGASQIHGLSYVLHISRKKSTNKKT